MAEPDPAMNSSTNTSHTTPNKKTPKKMMKKSRTAPNHPKIAEMVNSSITNLKERGGSSLQAIKKHMGGQYKVDVEKLAPFIKKYLKQAVANGALVQTKGKGASGSFKLGHGHHKEKKGLKATPKKTKSEKKEKEKEKVVKKVAKTRPVTKTVGKTRRVTKPKKKVVEKKKVVVVVKKTKVVEKKSPVKKSVKKVKKEKKAKSPKKTKVMKPNKTPKKVMKK